MKTQVQSVRRFAAFTLGLAVLASSAAAQGPYAQTLDLGGNCGAGFPSLNSTQPVLTANLTMFVTTVYPDAPITLFVQPPLAAPIDLGSGCLAYVDGIDAAVFSGTTDSRGNFSVTVPVLSLVPFLPGIRCDAQAIVLVSGPGTVTLNNGVQGVITNGIALIMGFAPPGPPNDVPPSECAPCTKTRAQWTCASAWNLFVCNYSAVLPTGLEVGRYDLTTGNLAPNGKKFTTGSTGRSKLKTYLAGAGSAGTFCNDTINNDASSGAGALGRNVAALTINIALNDAGLLGGACFGDLVFVKVGDPLNGRTVRQILVTLNDALAGLGFPGWYCPPDLNALAVELNKSFENCVQSTWAGQRLFRQRPPITS